MFQPVYSQLPSAKFPRIVFQPRVFHNCPAVKTQNFHGTLFCDKQSSLIICFFGHTKQTCIMSSPSPSYHMLGYPGSNVTFNLVKLERMKKSDESVVSDLWENDYAEEDGATDLAALPVYGRIMLDEGDCWISVHRGSTPALIAPLFLRAEPPVGCTVSLRLRDYSNRENRSAGGLMRNEQCIRRLFKFTFAKRFEAVAFQCCHNCFLIGTDDPDHFNDDNENRSGPDASQQSMESADLLQPNANTSAVTEESMLLNQTMESIINDRRHEDEEEAARRAIFEMADRTTLLDDQFPETQDQLPDDFSDSY